MYVHVVLLCPYSYDIIYKTRCFLPAYNVIIKNI